MYVPKHAPVLTSLEDLRKYVEEELKQIGLEMQQSEIQQWRILHVEPLKITDGMVVFADGTDWNPGSGQGLYERVAGIWVKL
jgi:hypothetical protein